MKYIACTVCYIHKERKLLFQRKDKDPQHNLYGYHVPPGGKQLKNEFLYQTNIREVLEEVGVEVINSKYRGLLLVPLGEKLLQIHIYETFQFLGDPKMECNEGTHFWVDEDRVSEQIKIREGDKYLLELLKENNLKFFIASFEYSTSGELTKNEIQKYY